MAEETQKKVLEPALCLAQGIGAQAVILVLAIYLIRSELSFELFWIWFATSSAVAPLAVRVRISSMVASSTV